MPKLKTHSGAKKRFKLSKNGKVIRAHAYMSHLANGHGKTPKTKRHARGTTVADKTNEAAIKRMLPYNPGPQWGPSRTDRAGRRDARCRSCSSRDQRTCAPGAMLKCFARLSRQADAGKLKIADTKLPVLTGRSGGSAARSAT